MFLDRILPRQNGTVRIPLFLNTSDVRWKTCRQGAEVAHLTYEFVNKGGWGYPIEGKQYLKTNPAAEGHVTYVSCVPVIDELNSPFAPQHFPRS